MDTYKICGLILCIIILVWIVISVLVWQYKRIKILEKQNKTLEKQKLVLEIARLVQRKNSGVVYIPFGGV
jgi:Na+-transporting NADH:ubiquinone oxidoreductase subunit NqrC